MPQTWISRATGKMFKVDKNQPGINPAVEEEFKTLQNPEEKEKARILLESKPSQKNPQLN